MQLTRWRIQGNCDNDDFAAPVDLQPRTGVQGNRELKAEGLPQQ